MGIGISVRSSDGLSRTYEFHESAILGRDPEQASVVLEDAYVSRLHGVIQRRKDGRWVYIHRGRNPTRLGKQELNQPGQQVLLTSSCVLKVGGSEVTLDIVEEAITELYAISVGDLDADLEGYEANPELEETCMDEAIPELHQRSADRVLGPELDPHDAPSLETPMPEERTEIGSKAPLRETLPQEVGLSVLPSLNLPDVALEPEILPPPPAPPPSPAPGLIETQRMPLPRIALPPRVPLEDLALEERVPWYARLLSWWKRLLSL